MNESTEKTYAKRLEAEFPNQPLNVLKAPEEGELSIDELYEERVVKVADLNIDTIFSNEDYAVAHCEKLILFYLLEEGMVYYEDIVSMLHTEAVMAESVAPSFETYALRKAWQNITKLLDSNI